MKELLKALERECPQIRVNLLKVALRRACEANL